MTLCIPVWMLGTALRVYLLSLDRYPKGYRPMSADSTDSASAATVSLFTWIDFVWFGVWV